jgi:hypothetical protein
MPFMAPTLFIRPTAAALLPLLSVPCLVASAAPIASILAL